MRTTLTIEDSILQKLKQEAFNTGLPLKKVVNLALEIGLRNLQKKQPKKRIKLKRFSMGFPQAINLDKALDIAAALEDFEIIKNLRSGNEGR